MRLFLKITGVAFAVLLVLLAGIRLGSDPASLPSPLRGITDHGTSATWNEAAGLVKRDYYRKISNSEIQNAGVDGLVASLKDRFSNYFDPAEYKRFRESENPHFSGVGLNVQFAPDGLRVTKVIDGTPAQRAGLKVGDTIIAVGGKSLKGKGLENSVALVKGKPGTKVTVTVREPSGKAKTLNLTRQTIIDPVVEAKLVTGPAGRKVGVVALAGFVQGAGVEVAQAVAKLRKQGAQAFVLDLRGNGGGLLDEAVSVGSVFIERGPIVSTKGRNRERQVYLARGGAIPGSVPVVVLVDRGSASASEIVAGAIQDRHRGVIVGTRTFGKGVFQEVTELNNGGALDITVGEFFTPAGRNLGGRGVQTGAGITPNVKVPAAGSAQAALNAAVAQAATRVK